MYFLKEENIYLGFDVIPTIKRSEQINDIFIL